MIPLLLLKSKESEINPKMDTLKINIDDPQSLLDGAKYLLGLYSEIEGYTFAVTSIDKDHIDQWHPDDIISPCRPVKSLTLRIPPATIAKEAASIKLGSLYDKFLLFIKERCILDPTYTISANDLLTAFSHHAQESISKTSAFPELMKAIGETSFTVNNQPVGITKIYKNKIPFYKGITLLGQPMAIDKRRYRPSTLEHPPKAIFPPIASPSPSPPIRKAEPTPAALKEIASQMPTAVQTLLSGTIKPPPIPTPSPPLVLIPISQIAQIQNQR